MKGKLTKNLCNKAFLVIYYLISIIAYVALYCLFIDTYHKLTDPFDYYKFPLVSAIITALFVLLKIFLTLVIIKRKDKSSTQNLTGIIEWDFSVLPVFLLILCVGFSVPLKFMLEDREYGAELYTLIGVFIGTILLLCVYNILAICAVKCRREIFKQNRVLHFFITPVYFVLTLIALLCEFHYTINLNSIKFPVKWWDIVIPLAFYALSFLFIFILAKRSKITKPLEERILLLTVVMRILYSLLLGLNFLLDPGHTARLLITLFMTIPCLAGAFTAKKITNKKQ